MNWLRAELPKDIYKADEVRALDKIAIKELAISSYELMCRAGEAAFEALQTHWPHARSVAVVCGGGNNAGDGYVVARLALQQGFEVCVVAVVATEHLTGDAEHAWKDYCQSGGAVESPPDRQGLLRFLTNISSASDVIVDGLLGTGLTRDLEGDFLDAVCAINTGSSSVLALDIPTGLHADTGLPLGDAVLADVTVTFIGLKRGLFLGVAPDYRGRIEFSSLGIPDSIDLDPLPTDLRRLTPSLLKASLPPRAPTTHKGDNGSVLLVGGAPGMPGAIRLAAEAALRAGAGLVRVATHPESVASVMAGRAEVMCEGVDKPQDLKPLFAASDVVVLGPGLGQSAWSKSLWEEVLSSFEGTLILDADGLNLLSQAPQERENWILTPHPGEAARLLQTDVTNIQSDRLAAVRDLTQTFGGISVLKGASTLVAERDHIGLCDMGNPGMATAGMGDVLAGLLGGLAAQSSNLRLSLGRVARTGVLVHALCGDDVAASGERGLVAGDLIEHIRSWVNPS